MRIYPPHTRIKQSHFTAKLIVAIILISSSITSFALEFEFINDGPIPLSASEMKALHEAGHLWSDRFSDPITVKITVDWKKPEYFSNSSILASVQVGRTSAPTEMVLDNLKSEAQGSEASILAYLPSAIPVSHSSTPMNNISLSLVNAKALGITPANDPIYGDVLHRNADAHISFNLQHHGQFFLDQNNVISDKYDFVGVSAHEIGHAMGFTSVVDIQAMNPGVLLNPTLLDVFRFSGSVSSPHLTSSTRQTSPMYAQFFDKFLMNIPFSSGFDWLDPYHCAMPSMRCSASHWDDYSGNLMTSASKGTVKTIKPDDVHAVDRIGVDTKWRNGIPLFNVKAEFYKASGTLPSYDKEKFSTKTEAPAFSSVVPNFSKTPTHAFHISFDGHAGAGYAVFVPAKKNRKIRPIYFNPRDKRYDLPKQWESEDDVKAMYVIPAHFSHFYFESENSKYRFKFVNTFSNYGSVFDPSLGDFGGFRISGFLDGDLDGSYSKYKNERQDYDASMTMLLILEEPHDITKGIDNVPFTIKWQNGRILQDNIVHLIDNTAFDVPPNYNNSASYEDAWDIRNSQLLSIEDDPEPGRDIGF